MSKIRNHGNRDFTQYDSMTTEELEEILRMDAKAPEGQESDTDLLLYIMGVLSDRNANNTGKTALEAWESFQTQYLSAEEAYPEHDRETNQPVKLPRTWLRRMIAAAAVMALLVGIPVAASAFGWRDIWNAVAKWTKETFSFVSGDSEGVTGPAKEDNRQYTALQELLKETNRATDIVPTRVPAGYELKDISMVESPDRRTYVAFYTNGEKTFQIFVQFCMISDPAIIEIGEELIEIYEVSGIKYYIFPNDQQLRAVWSKGPYECYISGELTVEEIKDMIDSIGKG